MSSGEEITVVFPVGVGSKGTLCLRHVPHQQLRGYFKHPMAKPHAVLYKAAYGSLYCGRYKVRLTHVPSPGDKVVIVPGRG